MEKRSQGPVSFRTFAALSSLALLAVACSSSTTTDTAADAGGAQSDVNGTGSASGTIGGATLTVQAAFSDDTDTSKGEFGNVLLTDDSSFCTNAGNSSVSTGALALDLSLYTIDPEGGKVASAASDTGVYHVDVNDPSLQYVDATFYPESGLCNAKSTAATGGTATLATVNADGSYTGTYDLTFADGSHVTGAFASVACAGLSNVLGATKPSCSASQ